MSGSAALERITADLGELAVLSSPGPGTTRLAYSPEDAAARGWFERKCEEIGLRFQVDWVGNCFGWSPGAADRAPIVMGSHLDSVIEGGRYDGTLGVVVGFEVASQLLSARPDLPLGVIAFACEESTQFGIGTVGSRFLMGELAGTDADRMRARSGETLSQLLEAADLGEERVVVGNDFMSAYLEVHIDQGSMLTSAGLTLGLVDTIAGVHRRALRWVGEPSHSGAHGRARRRDALLGAAEFILASEAEWAKLEAEGHTLAVTVGQVNVSPNSPNTVPGRVELVLDIRTAEPDILAAALASLEAEAVAIAIRRGIELTVDTLGDLDSAKMSTGLLPTLAAVGRRLGIPTAAVLSLAGHDAMVVGKRFPAAMLFVANPSEISHSPDEGLDATGLSQAIALLTGAVPELAEQAPGSAKLA